MSLTVCTSATSTDGALSTTANLRVILGATSTAADTDAAQQMAIVRASRWADSYLRYPILSQVYSESLAAYGGRTLLLGRTPIRAILRVFDSTTTCEATSYSSTEVWVDDAEAGTLQRGAAGFAWTAQTAWGAGSYVPPMSEQRTWLVEYQAGYVYPETSSTEYGTTSTGRTLPEDLEYGVLLKAAELYQQDGDIQSQSIGDLSITYRSEGLGSDPRTPAERALAPYRRGW
ncbi:MAG: hypothetical protein NUW22_12620 [Acidobacteria bacterium]|nr:hypothetical protein [Acidobacteriota bacterium]